MGLLNYDIVQTWIERVYAWCIQSLIKYVTGLAVKFIIIVYGNFWVYMWWGDAHIFPCLWKPKKREKTYPSLIVMNDCGTSYYGNYIIAFSWVLIKVFRKFWNNNHLNNANHYLIYSNYSLYIFQEIYII